MDEIGTYVVLAVVVFLSSFFGNILGHYVRRWYDDRMFYKAFEPIYGRRGKQ